MKVGDKVEVRCYEVDSMGRVNLTMLKEGEAPLRAERPPMGGGRPNFRSFRDSR
jgi:predicted RNA-binding protein with RPS1 domain